MVANPLFYSAVYWGGSIGNKDAKRLDKQRYRFNSAMVLKKFFLSFLKANVKLVTIMIMNNCNVILLFKEMHSDYSGVLERSFFKML